MRDLLATAPSWFNVGNLKTIAIVVLVVLVAVAFLIARFVQKMVLKLVMVGLCIGLGVAVYSQRSNLSDCASSEKNCHCTVFGQDVRLPAELEQTCRQLGKL